MFQDLPDQPIEIMTGQIPPRRRGRRGSMWLLLLQLPLTGCGGDDEGIAPTLRVPDLGTYAYDAVIQTADSVADTLSGSIDMVAASEDSIVGEWAVTGYAGAPERGAWNVNAYTLPAQPVGPGGPGRLVTHRVWRLNASDDLQCQVAYQHIVQADTFISSTSQNSCSLLRAP